MNLNPSNPYGLAQNEQTLKLVQLLPSYMDQTGLKGIMKDFDLVQI